MTFVHPVPLPPIFAYAEDETFVEGKAGAVSIPLPAVGKGHPAFNGKQLYVSASGDHAAADAAPRVRVAINNGAGWTVKTVEVPSGGRVGVPVPAAANTSAYNVTVGRVDTGVAGHETLPLSVLIEIL